MSSRRKRSKPGDEADVDMTPMLDIVFIMLIFFIVSSTFIRESGLDLTEHQNDEQPEQNQNNAKAIIVQICEDEQIFIDQRAIDVRSVRANIERKLAEDSRAAVIIESQTEAPTGTLVSVMDQARAAHANISVSELATKCRSASAPTS